MVRVAFVSIFLLVLLTSCKPSVPNVSSTPPPLPAAAPAHQIQKIEACGLIAKEEVESIQSTAISDAKSSEGSDGVYLITQCYYASTRPNYKQERDQSSGFGNSRRLCSARPRLLYFGQRVWRDGDEIESPDGNPCRIAECISFLLAAPIPVRSLF